MRGKVNYHYGRWNIIGINPAHAGKSEVFVLDVAEAEDQPRACGDKVEKSAKRLTALGSTPRMRG